jgi:hypothetical protein
MFAKNPEREALVRQWAREKEALARVTLVNSTQPVTSTSQPVTITTPVTSTVGRCRFTL